MDINKMTEEQLAQAGRKALEAKAKQKEYDRLYLARQKWVFSQLVESYKENSNYNELLETAKGMTFDELTA